MGFSYFLKTWLILNSIKISVISLKIDTFFLDGVGYGLSDRVALQRCRCCLAFVELDCFTRKELKKKRDFEDSFDKLLKTKCIF